MQKFFFSIIVFIQLFAFGQSDQSLVQIAFPHENRYEIRIDNNEIYDTNSFYLSHGIHTVEIWNACMEKIIDTIAVGKGNFNTFRYKAEVSKEYHSFKNDLTKYRLRQFDHIVLPISLMIGSFCGAGYFLKQGRSQYDDLIQLKSMYETTSNSNYLLDYESNFTAINQRYNNTRAFYYTFLGLSAISTVYTIFGINRFRRNTKRPINNLYLSPFTQKNYALLFQISPNQFQITLNI
jgi:hypothetical protein